MAAPRDPRTAAASSSQTTSSLIRRKALSTVNEYGVAWIAALVTERAAATAMLDERHDQPMDFKQHRSDKNSYSWGSISGHNVVIASLSSQYGTISAARTAANMLTSLPNIKFGLLVGIGAGIPNSRQDVRLGDVVVSQTQGGQPGVVQYDLGKALHGGDWEPRGALDPPVEVLSRAITHLQAETRVSGSHISEILRRSSERYPIWASTSKYPGVDHDRLFKSSYIHNASNLETCSNCRSTEQIVRSPRASTEPEIHYGTIGSGNTLIKDARHRDEISRRIGSTCLCLEMEAAGVMGILPCMVVRGICDYADTHKNDIWQNYAAAVAAAYAKELLAYTPVHEVDMAQTANILLNDVRSELAEIKNTVQTSKTSKHESRVSRLLRSLYSCTYEERKNRNPKRVEGTCNWFTQHPMFVNWVKSRAATLLWASADPGCGKSVLSRYLIDEVFESLYDSSEITVCYFFFKDDAADQRSATGALCALFRQLLIHKPCLATEPLLDRVARGGEAFSKSFQNLWDIFIQTTFDPDAGDIICVLDALDECNPADCEQLIAAICGLYTSTNQYSKVRFLVTSRPYSYISDAFAHLESKIPTVHLGGENDDEATIISKEIDIVVRCRIQSLCGLRGLDMDEQQLLISKFGKVSHRTYLWAHLTLSLFEETQGLTKEKIVVLLKDLPKTVDEAYEKILNTRVDQGKARLAFQIMIAAARPLKLQELSICLAITNDHSSWRELSNAIEPAQRFKNTIRNLCGLFVVVIDEEVHFLHQTARQFLLEKSASRDVSHPRQRELYVEEFPSLKWNWKWSLRLLDCNQMLTERCLWYLYVENAQDSRWTAYCMENWHVHFRNSRISSKALEMRLATELCRGWDAGGVHVSALRKAAECGLFGVLNRLLNPKFRKQYTLEEKSEALWSATFGNFEDCARILLKNGANIETNQEGKIISESDRPLHLAVKSNNKPLVELLLQNKANIRARDRNGDSVLHIAAVTFDENIVSLLIRSGAERSVRNSKNQLPFRVFYTSHQARGQCQSKKMSERAFGLLFDGARSKMDVYLHRAAKLPCVYCVDVLLSKGANVSSEDHNGDTLLHHAAGVNSVPMIDLALAKGSLVDCRQQSRETPLIIATRYLSSEIVERLLQAGADPNRAGPSRMTPLLYAIDANATDLRVNPERHRLRIVELLLGVGANPNSSNDYDVNCLRLALESGRVEIVKLLINAGADINGRDRLGLSPLSIAASVEREDRHKMIKMLLAAGADLYPRDNEGNDCLDHALMQWDEKSVEVLLSHGFDVNRTGRLGRTPLMRILLSSRYTNTRAPFRHSRPSMLNLLLRYGADVKLEDVDGKTALQICRLMKTISIRRKDTDDYVSYCQWEAILEQAMASADDRTIQLNSSAE